MFSFGSRSPGSVVKFKHPKRLLKTSVVVGVVIALSAGAAIAAPQLNLTSSKKPLASSSTSTTSAATALATSTTPRVAKSYNIDFGAKDSPVATGYVRDFGQAFTYDRGYGWYGPTGPFSLEGNGRTRKAIQDTRLDTLIHMQLPADVKGVHTEGRFEAALVNGTYDVTVGVGDPSYTDSHHVLNIEHLRAVDFTPTSTSRTKIVSKRVVVRDGFLSVDADGGENTKLGFLSVSPVAVEYHIDFTTQDKDPAPYNVKDFGEAFSTTKGRGWEDLSGKSLSLVGNARVRDQAVDMRLGSFIHMQLPDGSPGVHTEGRYEVVVPVGSYDLTVGVGDPAYANSHHVLRAEGRKIVDYTPTAGASTNVFNATVFVSDGRLTIDAVGGSNTKLGFIDILSSPVSGGGSTPTTTTTVPPTTPTTVRPTTTTTAPPRSVWTPVFSENFDRNVGEGSFLSTYQNMGAYPTSYRDTSKKGQYNPGIISVNNGIMNMRLHTNSAGVPQVAAPYPNLPGGNNQLYGRYEVRFRADAVEGYKTAWLLWPQSENWPEDSEVDFPEGNLTGTIGAFMHYQDATWADYQTHLDSIRGNEVPIQDHFGTTARYTDWHTAVIEWEPTKITFILDGKVIGTSTKRLPRTPMHWVLQTETNLEGTPISRTATGNVQIDYVKVWKYTP